MLSKKAAALREGTLPPQVTAQLQRLRERHQRAAEGVDAIRVQLACDAEEAQPAFEPPQAQQAQHTNGPPQLQMPDDTQPANGSAQADNVQPGLPNGEAAQEPKDADTAAATAIDLQQGRGAANGHAAADGGPGAAGLAVAKDIAFMSPLIQREVLQSGCGLPGNPPLRLPKQVSPTAWELITEYCAFHSAPGRSDKERRAFDDRFLRRDSSVLCDLTSAADALEMRTLVDFASRAIARLIEGKSAEEIRAAFRLPDDLSEDEKLEPVVAPLGSTADPRVRMLNRLYAKRRKELQERRAALQADSSSGGSAEQPQALEGTRAGPGSTAQQVQQDERSLDELLDFIESSGAGSKVAAAASGGGSGKAGKSKRKKGKAAPQQPLQQQHQQQQQQQHQQPVLQEQQAGQQQSCAARQAAGVQEQPQLEGGAVAAAAAATAAASAAVQQEQQAFEAQAQAAMEQTAREAQQADGPAVAGQPSAAGSPAVEATCLESPAVEVQRGHPTQQQQQEQQEAQPEGRQRGRQGSAGPVLPLRPKQHVQLPPPQPEEQHEGRVDPATAAALADLLQQLDQHTSSALQQLAPGGSAGSAGGGGNAPPAVGEAEAAAVLGAKLQQQLLMASSSWLGGGPLATALPPSCSRYLMPPRPGDVGAPLSTAGAAGLPAAGPAAGVLDSAAGAPNAALPGGKPVSSSLAAALRGRAPGGAPLVQRAHLTHRPVSLLTSLAEFRGASHVRRQPPQPNPSGKKPPRPAGARAASPATVDSGSSRVGSSRAGSTSGGSGRSSAAASPARKPQQAVVATPPVAANGSEPAEKDADAAAAASTAAHVAAAVVAAADVSPEPSRLLAIPAADTPQEQHQQQPAAAATPCATAGSREQQGAAAAPWLTTAASSLGASSQGHLQEAALADIAAPQQVQVPHGLLQQTADGACSAGQSAEAEQLADAQRSAPPQAAVLGDADVAAVSSLLSTFLQSLGLDSRLQVVGTEGPVSPAAAHAVQGASHNATLPCGARLDLRWAAPPPRRNG